MKRYEKYKNSGIEWLGEIPEDWEVKRVKDIFRNTGSGTTPPSGDQTYYADFGINWLQTGDLNDGYIIETSKKITQKAKTEYSTLKLYPKDSLVIAMYGATIGKMGFLKINTTTNQACCVLSNLKDNNERYIFYQLLSMKNFVISLSTGGGQPNINQDVVKFLKLVTPPFNLQTAIAAYLDTITTAINRKIELLTAKAAKYKALRRSLINETVCLGLNPNVSLKNSGVEWIGMVPEHWEVKRFKSIANTVKGRNLELSDTYFENSRPNLSLEYLRNESVVFDTHCFTSDKNQKVTTDDMIIIWDGAGVGEILKGKDGFLSSTIAKIVVDKKKYNSRFLYHLRFSIEYILKMIPAGMGIPHLNPQVLNSFNCPCPPLEEQTAIANFLDEKTTQIDTILTNINEQVSKLTQLRKTLINDVVTGKIKVTD